MIRMNNEVVEQKQVSLVLHVVYLGYSIRIFVSSSP